VCEDGDAVGGNSIVIGGLAALMAAFSFALWNVYLQRGLATGAPALLALLPLALCEIVCFLPVALILARRSALPPLAPRGVAWFFLAGVMTTVVGSYLATHATRLIGAAETTAIRLLDPFFAFAIAAIFLHESIAPRALVGIAVLAVALLLLRGNARHAPAARGGRERPLGLGLAVATSLAFTVGSVIRKAGLLLVPSAIVAAACEGIAGTLVIAPIVVATVRREGLADLTWARGRDLWLSGLAAAAGTFFLNIALQRVAVPVAVALRNLSPWFTLFLLPLLLGTQHRATRAIWWSTALLTAGMLLILSR